MNDTETYIIDSIKTWVWSGFYTQDEVQEMIDDIIEDGVDVDKIRSTVAPEFEKKAIAEKSWPEVTDCDRLDQFFGNLNDNGIVGLQNAGYTMSDGLSDVSEEIGFRDRSKLKGYCFYHGQDLERAVAGSGLMLAFGDLDDTPEGRQAIGRLVVEFLSKAGFESDWDGTPDNRIHVPKLDWKRRFHQWTLISECDERLPLPPTSSFEETLQNLNPESNSFYVLANGEDYIQCGGSRQLCTVELRQYQPDGTFKHYVFCHASGSDEPLHIPMSAGGVTRQKKHGLTSADAARLFECYYAHEPWPLDLAPEDITNDFM